jgi:hypothetical protein
LIVIDRQWQENSDSGFDFGVLVWKEKEDKPYFLKLLPDDYISWTIVGPKRCIGSRNSNGDLIKCPEMTMVSIRKRQCGPCSAMDFFDPCIRCSGKSCNATKEREERCTNTDYAVYLALFSDKTFKVGVSVKSRILIRWIEQGADYGTIITEVRGGMRARQIEDILAKITIMKKRVHPTRKSDGILKKLSFDEAQDRATQLIDSFEHHNFDFKIHINDITDLTKYYNLTNMGTQPIPWLERKTTIDGKQLFGHIVGMKGSHLVTRIKNAFTITNIHHLIGYTINSEKEIKAVTQSGLLDYL